MSFIELFEALDRLDAAGWAAQLSPDVVMRYARGDPVYGRAAARTRAEELLAGVGGLSHEIIDSWEHGEATVVEATVHFQLHGDGEVTLPAVTTFRRAPTGLVGDYRVYIDPRPLYAARGDAT